MRVLGIVAWAFSAALCLSASGAIAQNAVTVETSTIPVVCGLVNSTTKVSETQSIPFEFQTEWDFQYLSGPAFDSSAVDCCHFTFGADGFGNINEAGAVFTAYNLNPADGNTPGSAPSWLWDGIEANCPDYQSSHTITFGSTCRTTLTTIPASTCSAGVSAEKALEAIQSARSSDPSSPKLVPAEFIFEKSAILENIQNIARLKPDQTFSKDLSNLEVLLTGQGCSVIGQSRIALDTDRRSSVSLLDCPKGYVVVSVSARRIPARHKTEADASWSFNYLRDAAGRRSSSAHRRIENTYVDVTLYHGDVDDHAWLAALVAGMRLL